MLLFGQAFVWGVGWLAAQAAADHAAQTARVVDGSEAAGNADAHDLLAQLGGRFLDDPTVHIQRGPWTTTVTIAGTAHGLPLPITVTVHAPTESVVPR
ncbi:TadE family protein [Phytohabitans rumicis]|uniref:TadE family protein n=1 Tax=Phytohabitans rumicis TaxID=1076125 RepID=UPI001564D6C4|nr:TadE family protein [Phytohabitans rumicis]